MSNELSSAPVYPARLDVDYVEQHNRVTTLFRLVLIVPVAIVIGLLTAGATQTAHDEAGAAVSTTSGGITASLFLATLLMILFRRRYPRSHGSAPASARTWRCSPTSTRPRSSSRVSTSRSTIPRSNAT
jgi:uncharacterized protein (TIGR03382 family)